MVLKRLPLFILGGIYGLALNGSIMGLAHAVAATGYVVVIICRAIGETGGDCSCLEGEGNPLAVIFVCLIGAALAIACVGGFVWGFGLGLFKGTWHCAMDFYNNGIRTGLSSPFRFLKAIWAEKVNKNQQPLAEYYQGTARGVLERREAAKEKVGVEARAIDTTLTEIREENETAPLPKGVTQIIAILAANQHQDVFEDKIQAIGNYLESIALPQGDAANRTVTVELSDEELIQTIKADPYFSERQADIIANKSSKKQSPSSFWYWGSAPLKQCAAIIANRPR